MKRDRREEIALEIWNRFAPSHELDFGDDSHRAEYLLCADDILAREKDLVRQLSAAARMLDRYEAPTTDDADGSELSIANRIEAMVYARDLAALTSPAPVAGESKALGIALAALQHIQGMEPITHEITLATVMANHAVDALKEIEELGATSCPNPCGECRGVVVAGKCDTCGWEVE